MEWVVLRRVEGPGDGNGDGDGDGELVALGVGEGEDGGDGDEGGIGGSVSEVNESGNSLTGSGVKRFSVGLLPLDPGTEFKCNGM